MIGPHEETSGPKTETTEKRWATVFQMSRAERPDVQGPLLPCVSCAVHAHVAQDTSTNR